MLDFVVLFFSDTVVAYLKNPQKSKLLRLLVLIPNYLMVLLWIWLITRYWFQPGAGVKIFFSLAFAALFLIPALHFTRIILFGGKESHR